MLIYVVGGMCWYMLLCLTVFWRVKAFLLHKSWTLSLSLSVIAFLALIQTSLYPPTPMSLLAVCVLVLACVLYRHCVFVRFSVCVCMHTCLHDLVCACILLCIVICMKICVCFVCLFIYHWFVYIYGYFHIVCFSLSCKVLWVSESSP